MTRGKWQLGSEDWIPLLLGGFAGAVWMLLLTAHVAAADDCLRYVREVKNFVAIPKDLLEDCMRTGSVQAIITMILGGIGGGVIATAVGKGLTGTNKKDGDAPGPDNPEYQEGTEGPKKDNPWDPSEEEKKKKWNEEKVVWDPRDLGWRRPRKGELPPADEDPARKGPSKDEIKEKWEKEALVWDKEKNIWRKKTIDESPPPEYPPEEPPYARSNPRAATPPECLELYDAYVRSQKRLLELEPEMDKTATDLRMAQDWLQLKLGIFTAQFAVDMTDFMQFGTAMVRAAGPISQAIGKAGSVGGMIKAAGRKAAQLAKALSELMKELAELGAKAGKLRTIAGVLSESARVLTKYADDFAEVIIAMDKRVASSRRLMAVAAELEPLAAKRGAVVAKLMQAEQKLKVAEQVWQRRQQLQRWAEGERASITAEQARLAISVKEELDAINEEIIALRQKVAQSPEVTNAATRTSKATTTFNDLQERIIQLEARAKEVAARLDVIRKPFQLKQAFKEAEAVRDAAAAAVDAADAEIRRIQSEIDSLADSPALQQLKKQESDAFWQMDQARDAYKQKARDYMDLQMEHGRITKELEDAIEARGGIPPMTSEEYQTLQNATKEMNDAQEEMMKAETTTELLGRDYDEAVASTNRQRKRNLEKYEELDFDSKMAAAEQTKADAAAKLQPAQESYDQAAKELQPLSYPGLGNVDEFPDLESELDFVRSELRRTRADQTAAKTEFDQAYAAEQQVKQQVEVGPRQALDARKADAEARLRGANRDWQQVVAENGDPEFQSWKLEVEGTDPFNEADAELRPLQEEVLEGRKAEAEIEKDINARRDQVGNETPESLQRKLEAEEAELKAKQQEAATAREKAEAGSKEAQAGEKEAADAEAAHAAKEAEVKNAQARHAEAEAEAAREASDIDPNADPAARGAAGVIDDLSKRSKELSDQVKPGWARGTEEALRSAFGAFGEKWNKYFNGQSPDEVAQGLKKSRDKVIRLKEELDGMKNEYDTLRIQIQAQKPALDTCVQNNTYWKGPSSGE